MEERGNVGDPEPDEGQATPVMNINIPVPQPTPDGVLILDGVTVAGRDWIRIGITSAMFGVVFTHFPADQARKLADGILTTLAELEASHGPKLIIPETHVTLNGHLHQPL